jgi:hypothetical protein
LTDGLELYDTVAETLKLVHFGCLQHCRTYYHKAAQVTELPSGKTWLFAQTQQGARASANLYSLVSCARVNDLEPYAYLRYLFEDLPKATTAESLEALLPWNVKAVQYTHRAAA